MKKFVDFEQAEAELHELIRDCDADCLGTMYEQAFGSVASCEEVPGEDYFEVEYHEGLEPE